MADGAEKKKVAMTSEELSSFCDQVALMLNSGMTIRDGIEMLAEDEAKENSKNHPYTDLLPVAEETDLKKAARAAGEKSMEMIHVKELTPLTGYVRGGCSPLGMKKLFTTFIHSSALDFAEIYVSGGRIGLSLKVAPQDLAGVTGAKFADIIAEKA